MKHFKLILVLPLLYLSGLAWSPVAAAEFHPIASIGYDFLGDTMFRYRTIKINNRPVNRPGRIKAGQGMTMALGFYMPLVEQLGIQSTIGLKIDSKSFIDGYFAFSRTPVDLLAVAHLSEHSSFSAGVTYHLSPTFTFETSQTGALTDTFNDALGNIVEYNYAANKGNEGGFKLGIRYTKIQYDLPNSNVSFDGSSIGFIIYAY